eukprot:TRINITY_DN2277_c0_g1_i6.p1 TRINITY_DN2277_c0_g1~~TRINITY_DN2277_c0_g1_i6.p1  ORF type:complete len:312 (-),score=67.62 TRINITY_DN2277_c0_g1_i6:82-1017(-)
MAELRATIAAREKLSEEKDAQKEQLADCVERLGKENKEIAARMAIELRKKAEIISRLHEAAVQRVPFECGRESLVQSLPSLISSEMDCALSDPRHLSLVERLWERAKIKSLSTLRIMRRVDFGDFIENCLYQDQPVSLGYSASINAPHVIAMALDMMKKQLRSARRILEIGSGSGYFTTCLAHATPSNAVIYALEHVPQLAESSLRNIRKHHGSFLDSGKIVVLAQDGRAGLPSHAPFDIIYLGAALQTVPESLLAQLRPGGAVFGPVGSLFNQEFVCLTKDTNGSLYKRVIGKVMFAYLGDLAQQLSFDA